MRSGGRQHRERRAVGGAEVPPGSESGACTHGGSPGTWEVLWSPQQAVLGRETKKRCEDGPQEVGASR
jgi:hypothetical protein